MNIFAQLKLNTDLNKISFMTLYMMYYSQGPCSHCKSCFKEVLTVSYWKGIHSVVENCHFTSPHIFHKSTVPLGPQYHNGSRIYGEISEKPAQKM